MALTTMDSTKLGNLNCMVQVFVGGDSDHFDHDPWHLVPDESSYLADVDAVAVHGDGVVAGIVAVAAVVVVVVAVAAAAAVHAFQNGATDALACWACSNYEHDDLVAFELQTYCEGNC